MFKFLRNLAPKDDTVDVDINIVDRISIETLIGELAQHPEAILSPVTGGAQQALDGDEDGFITTLHLSMPDIRTLIRLTEMQRQGDVHVDTETLAHNLRVALQQRHGADNTLESYLYRQALKVTDQPGNRADDVVRDALLRIVATALDLHKQRIHDSLEAI